jgi:SAM-dependent methyltransferase
LEQRFTFDQVASVYRTARPTYPAALVDDVVAYAELKAGDRILEVGCGTGQATKGFAERGFSILATDPGSEMILGARECLATFKNVDFLETTFEACPAERAPFRLIFAAQSWHWVSGEVRYSKAADLLSETGSLAVFGNVPVGLPPALFDRFKDIYLRRIGTWGPAPEAWYLPQGPFKGWFDESALFSPVEHRYYPWEWRQSSSSYRNFLRTRSEILLMADEKREALLNEIGAVIDEYGPSFDMKYEAHLYIARRAPRDVAQP